MTTLAALPNKVAPLPPWLFPAIILLLAVLLLGTALVGLVVGRFRVNAMGSTTVINRREQPAGYWNQFLVLVVGGERCA